MSGDSASSLPANLAAGTVSTAKTYLDFHGLARLRGQAVQQEKAALSEAAQQFEALFIQMMLKSMREAVVKDDASGSQAEDLYQDLMDRELSVQFAKREMFGVANMLSRQVGNDAPAAAQPTSTEQMLNAHSAAVAQDSPAKPRGMMLRPQAKAYGLIDSSAQSFQIERPVPIGLKPADLVPIKKDESKND